MSEDDHTHGLSQRELEALTAAGARFIGEPAPSTEDRRVQAQAYLDRYRQQFPRIGEVLDRLPQDASPLMKLGFIEGSALPEFGYHTPLELANMGADAKPEHWQRVLEAAEQILTPP